MAFRSSFRHNSATSIYPVDLDKSVSNLQIFRFLKSQVPIPYVFSMKSILSFWSPIFPFSCFLLALVFVGSCTCSLFLCVFQLVLFLSSHTYFTEQFLIRLLNPIILKIFSPGNLF